MSSVDERVVEMRFDNRQFESGVKTSMSTLDKLKSSLSGLDRSASSLTNFQKEADSFNMANISDGVDKIADRFSVLGIVADQIIRRLTNGLFGLAVQAANVVKSLTIAPIFSGYSKYEEESKAIQVLMNATKKGMDEVEVYAEKLRWYSNETSYSYQDMLKFAGQFTSAGVPMEEAIGNMMGIGNAAGLAGASVEQASHAMQGFAKAIGQGYLDTNSWSWIKTARMDTKEFKQQLIEAAANAGKLKKEIDKSGNAHYYVANKSGAAIQKLGEVTSENFENFLGQKVFTKEAIVSTLSTYSKATEDIYAEYEKNGELTADIIDRMGGNLDQFSLKAFQAANETRTFSDAINYIKDAASTGWAQTFKLIFGNYEESIELWKTVTDQLYDIFLAGLDARIDLLKAWHEGGGYTHVVKTITNSLDALLNIIKAVKKAFNDVFPPMTAEKLLKISEGISNCTEKFVEFTSAITDEDGNITGFVNKTFSNLIITLKGFLSVISLVGKAIKTVFKALEPSFSFLKQVGDKIVETFAKIGDSARILNNSGKTFAFFTKTSRALTAVQKKLYAVIGNLNKRFSEFVGLVKDDIKDGLKGLVSGISVFWKVIKDIYYLLKPFNSTLKSFGDSIWDFLSGLGIDFAKLFGNFGRFLTELDKCVGKTERLTKIQEKLSEISAKVSEKINEISSSIRNAINSIKNFAKKVKDTLKNAFGKVFTGFDFSSLGKVLTGLGAMLAGVNFYRLADHIDWFRKRLLKLKVDLEELHGTVLDTAWVMGMESSARVLKSVAISIAILAFSLLLLASIEPEALTRGLVAITTLMAELYAVMDLFNKKKIFESFSKGGFHISFASTNILKLAASVLLMAMALKMISKIKPEALYDSLMGLTVIIAELTAVAIILSKKSGAVLTGASGMIAMASAVLILSIAAKTMASIDKNFMQSILGVVVLLMAIATVAGVLSNYAGKMTGVATGMIGMAASLVIMAYAVKKFSEIDPNSVDASIFSIATLMGIIVAFDKLSGNYVRIQGLSTALIGIATSFVIMGAALKIISTMDVNTLGTSVFAIGALMAIIAAFNKLGGNFIKLQQMSTAFIGIAASFVIMGAALKILSSMDLKSLAVSVATLGALLLGIGLFANNVKPDALAKISAGLLIFSVALLAMVPGLLALGASGELAIAGIVALAGVLIVLGMAATVIAPVIKTLLALSGVLLIISVSIAIAGAGLMLLGAGITSFTAALALGVVNIFAAFDAILLGIASIATSLVSAVAIIVVAIVTGLAKAVPQVVSAALQLVLGILNALVQYTPQIIAAVAKLLIGMMNTLAEYIGPLTESAINLIVSFINGMADAIANHADDILGAIGNLIGAIIVFLAEAIAKLIELIPGVGSKWADKLRSGAQELRKTLAGGDASDAGEKVASTAVAGAESVAPEMSDVGGTLGSNFVSGVNASAGEAEAAGENEGTSFIGGLDSIAPLAASSGVNLSGASLDAIKSHLNDFVTAGEDSGQGFVSGIESELEPAQKVGLKIGNDVIESTRNALDSHSPSKEFISIGEDVGEGFIIGMESTFTNVYNSGKKMGELALEGLAKALEYVSNFFSSDEFAHPVITPVLDLSNIQGYDWSSLGGTITVNAKTAPSGVSASPMITNNKTSDYTAKFNSLISINQNLLQAVQSGGDVYLDGNIITGYVNAHMGKLNS